MINYDAIKIELENMVCSEHGGHPTVTVIGDKVNLKCCCDRFKEELILRMKELITEQTISGIRDIFRQ